MNIDTDRLITEVRFRPALWDSTYEFYKDRDAKVKAWLEVCEEVIPNFDDLSDVEKKLTEKQVQQRWKTARDAYVRSKTSGSDNGRRKKYIYFDYMQFLDKKHPEDARDLIVKRHNTIDLQQINNEPDSQCSAEDSLANKVTSSNTSKTTVRSTSRGTIALRRHHTKPQKGVKRVQRKRKVCDEDDEDFKKEMLKLFKDNLKLMQNDDMSFFCSLLPITQTFDTYQKLAFRSEVLKKAMEISTLNTGDPLEISHAAEVQESEGVAIYPKKEIDEQPE